jgi:glyoxylate reductase
MPRDGAMLDALKTIDSLLATDDRRGMRVFITRKLVDAAAQTLCAGGCEVEVSERQGALAPEELRKAIRRFDGVICLLSDRIDAGLIRDCPRVKVYANYAVGFDNMDVDAATRAGVALSNTPDVLTGATAEIAWALMFAVARRIVEGDSMVREGRFGGWAPMMLIGRDVSGATLGIVGAGRIGSAMATRARGFDMRILYTRRSGPSPDMEALGAKHVDLHRLLRESDYISIHCPLTPETRHMIGAEEFGLVKSGAILINTARGPVVDEKELVKALASGRLAGAGLDVYEREPEVEPGLLGMDNVVLAPHIGSATLRARNDMAVLAARNVLDFFAGRVPRTCINPGYVEFSSPR